MVSMPIPAFTALPMIAGCFRPWQRDCRWRIPTVTSISKIAVTALAEMYCPLVGKELH
jgi:hypothetical protein